MAMDYIPFDYHIKLIMISYTNRLYGGNPDQKYSAEVVVYKWSVKHTSASIVDLKSYRKS